MSSAATRSADSDHLWSVDEHLEDILSTVRPLEPIELQLLDAQGCVLVDDVTVPVSLPPFDNSSMDGYAVRVADVAGAGSRRGCRRCRPRPECDSRRARCRSP
ncbi:hypothetical protein ACWC19_40825, partial [Streptomyces sp. 900105245]